MTSLSILEKMVTTERLYKSDNFLPLQHSCARSEYLYQVRIYEESSPFRSVRSGNLRMRMLLGFIEAKAIVIDAIIKSDDSLHYLSVMCTSPAPPRIFSNILHSVSPRIIIEEIDRRRVEDALCGRAVYDSSTQSTIPFARAFKSLHESRRMLITILLEYRALVAEYAPLLQSTAPLTAIKTNPSLTVPFLFFEQDGELCGLPEFQVQSVSPGANGSSIVQINHDYGSRVLVCSNVVSIKHIPIPACRIENRRTRGYYPVSAPVGGINFSFTLIIPSYL